MAKAIITESRTNNLTVTIEPNELRKIADAIEKSPGVPLDKAFIPLINEANEMVVSIRFVAPKKE